ncbi:hypothetical protein ABTM79_19400, partial [Acinetobacter baumannii]
HIFAQRFKNRLYALFMAFQVLNTGFVAEEPTAKEKLLKTIGRILSLAPLFGGQASALLGILGDSYEHVQKVIALWCTGIEAIETSGD